jgi:hypothetical protein
VTAVAFRFHAAHPVVEVVFRAPDGRWVPRRLIVDSGFTGASAFVLPAVDAALADRAGPAGRVAGALSGVQERAWLIAAVPALRFRDAFLGICTDVSPLVLPAGVDGLAGLRFLQRFQRWGAYRNGSGAWSFELALPEERA